MRDQTDQQLLAAIRAGDDEALEALLARHQAQIYRFALGMCRDPDDAKDVLQETLLAVARGAAEFRGEAALSTWLYTIAQSFCIKKQRKGKFEPAEVRSLERDEASGAAQVRDPARPPDEAIAARQVEHALERAIATLEPPYREVLLLRDVEGLTAPEVAGVLGVSVDAVKSRLHRARLAVRAQVAPMLEVPAEASAAAPRTCPDVLTLFSRHLEGELDATACAEMERHVAACAQCRGACDSLKRTLALCRTSPAAAVPTAVQRAVRVAVRDFLARQS